MIPQRQHSKKKFLMVHPHLSHFLHTSQNKNSLTIHQKSRYRADLSIVSMQHGQVALALKSQRPTMKQKQEAKGAAEKDVPPNFSI